MAKVVGLDLGSHAVRAAEVRIGDPPELLAFGQVGLTRGSIVHGEVVDPGAVASALKRLWRESNLRDRRVRVGLANLRTIVRQVELPEMDDDELRSAIEFQAGDFIPLPPEDTVLDFRVLEPFEDDGGNPMLRVLLAAVHRDTLESALVAVREAGLQAVAVDLVPFALVRALGTRSTPSAESAPPPPDEQGGGDVPPPPPPPPGPESESEAEAIVSVGSGVSVVVVHESGAPRFVRIVDTGGDVLTEAIEQAIDEYEFDDAEALKRRLDDPTAERRGEAQGAVEGPLAAIVNEIRGSIDFYASQASARPLRRALMTGGASLTSGFLTAVGDALDVPVEVADPLAGLRVGDIGFDDEQFERLRPYLGVPVGLALGGDKDALIRINLLPEAERRVLAPSRLALAGGAAAAAVLAVLALITAQRNQTLNDEKDRLAEQQATNSQLQGQIASLEDAQDLQTETDDARLRVADVLGTDVSWSRVLQEIARVIPGDVWLESFQGTVNAATEGQVARTITGSASFTAVGSDFPSAAAWLQRLSTLPSFSTPWVSEASRGERTIGPLPEFEAVGFNSTAAVTESARSERSRRSRSEAGLDVGEPDPGDAVAPDASSPEAGSEGTP